MNKDILMKEPYLDFFYWLEQRYAEAERELEAIRKQKAAARLKNK